MRPPGWSSPPRCPLRCGPASGWWARGSSVEYPFEEAYFLPYARQFLDALSLPLILLGGVNRLETVEAALAEGFAFVAMARALLREPDLVSRWETGLGRRGAVHPLQQVHAHHLLRHPLRARARIRLGRLRRRGTVPRAGRRGPVGAQRRTTCWSGCPSSLRLPRRSTSPATTAPTTKISGGPQEGRGVAVQGRRLAGSAA